MKTQNEIVEEIHNSFYEEQTNLLKINSYKQDLIDKAQRLKKIGIVKSGEMRWGEVEEKKKKLRDAIEYYSNKYFCKVITIDIINKICKKYNLIYGTIDKYKEIIPEKNLAEIEKIKIDEKDECYSPVVSQNVKVIWNKNEKPCYENYEGVKTIIDIEETDRLVSNSIYKVLYKSKELFENYQPHEYYANIEYEKNNLIIIAPKKHFDTTGMKLKNNKLINTILPKAITYDPIVIQPLYFNKDVLLYIVITAWGKEAEDSDVINVKLN